MGLQDKIEEIRQKPEHIRIRYVWGAVAVCMFFILMLWAFSVKENFSNIGKEDVPFLDVAQEVQQETSDTASIKDYVNRSKEEFNKLNSQDFSREIEQPSATEQTAPAPQEGATPTTPQE